jgi:hypothetical protein
VTGHRGRRPPLTEKQILAWADAHFARTGRWPSTYSGPVTDAPGETWGKINSALYDGFRGLPGGDSLAKLLYRHQRGRRKAVPGRPQHSWLPGEDELLRTLPPEEVARRTGRSLLAVYVRCHELGLPYGLTAA